MSVPQVIDWQEFDRLIDGACDWTLSADDWAKLSQRLGESSEACEYYLACMDIHGTLAWQMMPNARLSPAELRQYNQAEIDLLAEADCLPDAFLPVSSVSPSSFFGNTIHSAYYGTISFFSQELPFSLFIATVLTGLGLWIASLVYVSSPERIAQNSSSRTPLSGDPTLEVVGKITSMVGCQWSRDGREPSGYDNVLMGRQFKLDSGLMEITYNTGAKVILQGPVKYEVEPNGGYLAVGKLTGNLEKKANLATSAAGPFCIRTPIAIVTDLGTEFGVEVDRVGNTAAQVYQGTIELQPIKAGTVENSPLRLSQGDAAKVEVAQNSSPTVHRAPFKADGFTRQMPAPQQIVLFRDTFDSSSLADKWGDAKGYGLNECLLERQSGISGPISYFRGGCYNASNRNKTLVNPPEAPGKLCLLADYGEGGWVVLSRRFPRNVIVSAELNPMAVHWLDKSNPKVFSRDQTSSSWIALGIRGGSLALESPYLPLASSAGEVFAIHADGLWGYFEHGERIIGGRVLPSRPYRVAMCVVGERLRITVNEISLQLDPNEPNGWRKLRGWCRDNYVSIGVGNAVCFGGSLATRHDPGGRDLSSIDNLTIAAPSRADGRPNR